MRKLRFAVVVAALTIFTLTITNGCGGGGGNTDNNVIPQSMKPSEPRKVTAEAVDASTVVVSFEQPLINKGVTSYTVTCYQNGVEFMAMTGQASPITCSGLPLEKFYTFKVTANSNDVTGPASLQSNVVITELVTDSSTPFFVKNGDFRIFGIEKADGVYLYVYDKFYKYLRHVKVFSGENFYINKNLFPQGNTVTVFATKAAPFMGFTEHAASYRSHGELLMATVNLDDLTVSSVSVLQNAMVCGEIKRFQDEPFYQMIIDINNVQSFAKVSLSGEITMKPSPRNFYFDFMEVMQDKVFLAGEQYKSGFKGRGRVVMMDRDFNNLVEAPLIHPFAADIMEDTLQSFTLTPTRILMSIHYQNPENPNYQMLTTLYEVSIATEDSKPLYSTSNESGIHEITVDDQENIYFVNLGEGSSIIKLPPNGGQEPLWKTSLPSPACTSQIFFDGDLVFRLRFNYYERSDADYFAQTRPQAFNILTGEYRR